MKGIFVFLRPLGIGLLPLGSSLLPLGSSLLPLGIGLLPLGIGLQISFWNILFRFLREYFENPQADFLLALQFLFFDIRHPSIIIVAILYENIVVAMDGETDFFCHIR